MNRLAVVARFAPERRDGVEQLLAAGPPFDLPETGIDKHVVYLTTREAVFVFEGERVEWEVDDLVDDFFHPELQATLGEWRRLVEEEPHIGREIFAWQRGAAPAAGTAGAPGVPLVSTLMQAEFVAVLPEDTVGEAVEKLVAADAAPALVVDYGRLIGLLSPLDVLRAVAGRVHPSEARVRDWMSPVRATIEPDATPEEAAASMVENGLHHLPVVEGDRAVGLLSLRAAVAGRSAEPV